MCVAGILIVFDSEFYIWHLFVYQQQLPTSGCHLKS